MKLFSALNREQKEAIGLLQIGTFLEYFDLMLYVHMAVLLNELFFPQTDPHTTALLAAFSFCSTFVFRPIGALIFGWLGDNIGRKSTIILTTVIMSISCIIMANLPTYAQIGITAAWLVTFCRIAQGMSSMGEIMGAEIYIAESVPRPTSYSAVAFIDVAASLGTTAAVGVAALVSSFYFNWRIAFWVGAFIAILGSVARTRLRETPDFLEMKRQKLKESITISNQSLSQKDKKILPLPWKKRVRLKNLVSFFLIYCGMPLTFYLSYIYFTPMLKEQFGYSSDQIIRHNFFLTFIMLLLDIFLAFLSTKVHPIKILKVRGGSMLILMLLLPFLIMNLTSSTQLFILQTLILCLSLSSIPADAILLYYFPISKRFTYASFLYALTRALMYIITSFGLVYLGEYFGPFGLWFITLPVTTSYLYGVFYYANLEEKAGHLSTRFSIMHIFNKSFLYQKKSSKKHHAS